MQQGVSMKLPREIFVQDSCNGNAAEGVDYIVEKRVRIEACECVTGSTFAGCQVSV